MGGHVADTGDVHRPHRTTALGAAFLTVLTLIACAPSDLPRSSPAPTPSHATPTPGEVRVAAVAGDVELEITVPGVPTDEPGVHVSPAPDDSTAEIAFDAAALARADGETDPEIALTSPGTFATHPDGSVTVLVDDTAVGGLSTPKGARLASVDDTHLELRVSEGAKDGDRTAGDPLGTTLGTVAVEGTDWGDREGGRSLAVSPTDWARTAGQAGVDVAWAELVAADPEVDTSTMRDQLECHAIGAPDKPTWNLEPWRPDVGLLATMAARCNPTGAG